MSVRKNKKKKKKEKKRKIKIEKKKEKIKKWQPQLQNGQLRASRREREREYTVLLHRYDEGSDTVCRPKLRVGGGKVAMSVGGGWWAECGGGDKGRACHGARQPPSPGASQHLPGTILASTWFSSTRALFIINLVVVCVSSSGDYMVGASSAFCVGKRVWEQYGSHAPPSVDG